MISVKTFRVQLFLIIRIQIFLCNNCVGTESQFFSDKLDISSYISYKYRLVDMNFSLVVPRCVRRGR